MKNEFGWTCIVLTLSACGAIAQTNTFPSSGNVGIGTTAPSAPFQIEAGNDPTTGQANCGAESSTCPASAASGYGFSFDSDYSSGQYRWRWEPIDRGWNISLYLQEAEGTANSYSNVVRFGANQFDPLNSFAVFGNTYLGGSVGIGTSNPVGQLSNNSVNYGDLGSGGSAGSLNWVHTAADSGWNAISSAGANGLVVATAQTTGISFQVSSGAYNTNTGQRANHLFTVMGNGHIGVGVPYPGASLEVNGNVKLTSGSGATLIFSDGTTQSTAWTGALCGGDYAESVDVSGDRARYEPGDVLVLDPASAGRVIKSTDKYSTAVAGIYSTKPGVIGRRQTAIQGKNSTEIPMAMVGIVPTKVSAENGAIHPGDILVTSSTPGYAMKGTDRSLFAGAVVGKAMGALDIGKGMIEVLVSLQ